WLLHAKVDFVSGDLPITISARPALLVKLQITGIARIAMIAAPYLDSRARIAGKESHMRFWIGTGGVIRPVKVLLRTLRRNLHRHRNVARQQLIGSKFRRAVHQVRVDVKEFKPMLSQNLLYAFTVGRLFSVCGAKAIQRNRELPWPGRPISAFRQPYAARSFAEEALVRLHSGLHLRADRSIGAQQRKISVRRSAG